MATSSDESTKPKPSKYCSTCEINKTKKYCNNCEMSFCGTCITMHQKMKGTSDHIVKDIISETKIGSEGSQTAIIEVTQMCSKHPGEQVEQFCHHCVDFVCTKCKHNHTTHKVSLVTKQDYLALNRKVCKNKRQNLMAAIQNLEEYNSFIDTCTDDLKEAISLLADEQEKVKSLVEGLDQYVHKLHSIRNSCDVSLLWKEANASGTVMRQSPLQLRKDKKLPDVIEAILEKVYRPTTIWTDEKLSVEPAEDQYNRYDNIQLQSNVSVPNSRKYSGYKLCKECCGDKIILHVFGKSYIRILDVSNNSFVEKKSDRSIWEMVLTDSKEFLVVHGSKTQYCLLDKDLKYIDKSMPNYEFTAMAICKLHKDRYLSYAISENQPFIGRWSEVRNGPNKFITETGLSSVNFDSDRPMMMSYLNIQNQLLLCSEKFLYIFKYPQTSDFSKLDMRQHVSGKVCCITTDSFDNILLGDETGDIVLLDSKFKHKLILQIGCTPRDIGVNGNRVIITTEDNRVLIYGP